MECNEISESLNNHIKDFPYDFYKECINKFNKLKNDKIFRIEENEYILESIRINICYNQNKYKIVITNKEQKDICYRKLLLSKKQLKNIICQIKGIENDELYYMNDKLYQEIKDNLNVEDNKYIIYVNFIEKNKKIKSKIYEIKDYIYQTIGILLGIESLRLMEYQRLDRINYLKKYRNDELKEKDPIDIYYNLIKKFDWKEKEMFLIFSGSILQLLGTTYTKDIDLLIIATQKNIDYMNDINNILKDEMYDFHVLLDDFEWHKRDKILKYQKQWLTYILPRLGESKDIYDTLCNPKNMLFYFGMKCVSINMSIQRLISRLSSTAIPDLIMMNKINGIQFEDKICIPNLNIRQGYLNVYNNEIIKKLFNNIIKNMKEWHDIDLTFDDISKMLKRCNEEDNKNIFYGDLEEDNETKSIKLLHNLIREKIVLKYTNNTNFLLDISTEYFNEATYINKINIKNIFAIQSQKYYSKKLNHDKNCKNDFYNNCTIIDGKLNDNWIYYNKYNKIINNKYDNIILNFTIGYSIYDIDQSLKNINLISHDNTNIIIFCLNGDIIKDKFNKYNGRYEIRGEQEPIFGVYDMDFDYKVNLQKILIYYKSTYGVNRGSVEYIIYFDTLIQKFNQYNFKLIEKKSFKDFFYDFKNIYVPDKYKYISELHYILIFSKK